ncbi:uncharacterized protein [Halyomorpha halys]|uniref:uncharacterized protein n=1 Tax=Halyomorpha halys TaxID=286706 RepID=UPI0006D4DA83|nr:uncharacterized protein LOC106682483 [Halyomorpha halys]
MKCLKLLVFFLYWISIPDLCQSQDEFAGPYRIALYQYEQCPDGGTNQVYANSTRITKVSRIKYLYSSDITTDVVVDDGVTIVLDVAKFGNGGWKPNFMNLEFPGFCTSIKQMMPITYDAIMDSLHTRCPIQPGTYQMVDFDTASIKVASSVPNFPYGKYRADTILKINSTVIGCFRDYVDVIPDRRAQRQKKPKKNS